MNKDTVDVIDTTRNIDDVIEQLQKSKSKGATGCEIYVSHDKHTYYSFFATVKKLSEEELKQNEIKELEEKLNKLKS